MANTSIQKAVQAQKSAAPANRSVNTTLAGILDGENLRRRFEELLGRRTPQFLSSLVSMINENPALQKAFYESPMSVIRSALQAASYDLPIDPTLGFAYIVPFNNKVKDGNGNWTSKMQAAFVIGYKGMMQLCLRTGAYSRIPDAVDVREGELIRYDRLTGDAEFQWVEDGDEREKLPVIGYAGYFRLKNGAEKTLYMSRRQIEAHERKNRKGACMGRGWQDDFDAMARKTVIRRLCGKYALMSIEYQDGTDRDTLNLAAALAQQDFPEAEAETGEIIEAEVPAEEDGQRQETLLTDRDG